jgi:uncharacterized protein (TIGR03437 family)
VSGTATDSGYGNNGISSVTVNGVAASGGTASGSNMANWSASVNLTPGPNTITVVAKDASSNQNATTQTISVTCTVPGPPVVPAAGVTNGASFTAGASPGSIVTIFGTRLTNLASGIVVADRLPLPTELRGTSVRINGVAAPLFAIANVNGVEQINLQIPYEVTGQSSLSIVVTNNGVSSDPIVIPLQPQQPGIFVADWATGAGAILHGADYTLVSSSKPVARGEVVLIYATGLGPVRNAPPTGQPASASPLSETTVTPVVTFSGITASEILFSGLAPSFVGLYQVNVRVPLNAPSGNVDVVIQTGGQTSKAVKMAVQ